MSEGRVGTGRFPQASSSSSSSFRGHHYPVQRSTSSLTPPPWTLHLLRNWKIHKWAYGERKHLVWKLLILKGVPVFLVRVLLTVECWDTLWWRAGVDGWSSALWLAEWWTGRPPSSVYWLVTHRASPAVSSDARSGLVAPVCFGLLVAAAVINISVCVIRDTKKHIFLPRRRLYFKRRPRSKVCNEVCRLIFWK